MSAPTEFKYTPLPGKDWIRLLRLLPLSSSRYPVAILEIARLDYGITPYTTLSYSWGRNGDGDATASRMMLLDGVEVNITENLDDCLRRLQSAGEDRPGLLWVDAVCINQTDIEERNSQVAMMADIYKRASALIIWLGEDHETDNDKLAMEALETDETWTQRGDPLTEGEWLQSFNPKALGLSPSSWRLASFRLGCKLARRSIGRGDDQKRRSRVPQQWLWPKLVRYGLASASSYESLSSCQTKIDAYRLFHENRAVPLQLYRALGPRFLGNLALVLCDALAAIATLCERRYFARRWIIQEIFHSQPWSTSVRWGPFSAHPLSFVIAISHLKEALQSGVILRSLRERALLSQQMQETNRRRFEVCDAATNTLHMKNFPIAGEDPHQLLTLIRRFEATECSDDRDRIFAFLSLYEGETVISPDYNLSTNQAYIDFASKLVEQGALAIVLEMASFQHGKCFERSVELPSWTPDFRCRLPTAEPLARLLARGYRIAQDIADEPAKLSPSKRGLSFRARIGTFTSFSEEHLRSSHIRRAQPKIGDVACWIPQQGWSSSGFVLRRVADVKDCFMLVGDWSVTNDAEQEEIIGCVKDIRVQTIHLC